jgi:hypothetical protein
VETGFSFELADAVAYDELRPDDAAEAMEWAAECGPLDRSSTEGDVAAGTGQLSRLMVSFGWRCIALSRLVDDALDARVW